MFQNLTIKQKIIIGIIIGLIILSISLIIYFTTKKSTCIPNCTGKNCGDDDGCNGKCECHLPICPKKCKDTEKRVYGDCKSISFNTQNLNSFPDSVIILDPNDGDDENQKKVNEIWEKHGQTSALQNVQFGKNRTLILLKRGNYNITINVGYYMSVAGLGKSPQDVTVNAVLSHPVTDTGDHGHSTQCFWRSAENLTITSSSIQPDKTNTWSVSQACPLRRIICGGNLSLVDNSSGEQDWASGGFIADSQIYGNILPWGQQQWFTRNTSMTSWSYLGMWNYVFVGCKFSNTPPVPSCGKGNNVSVIQDTPIIAQKPTLFLDENGTYNILRPIIQSNTNGSPPDWTDGNVIPLSKFYITNSSDDDKSINNAIESGLHIFLSPGIYNLKGSINVNKNNTMILGYGMPTLIANNGPAIIVDDVDNVVVASVILSVADGCEVTSLLQWGNTAKCDHPGIAYDIFTRVGGDTINNTFCDKMVVINSNNFIGDNFWLWRADHGTGVGWTKNVANNALEVNGDNCIIYGLAAEHTQKDLVIWNGDKGCVYFYQSEMAYDGGLQPNQGYNDVVSYRVNGRNHKGYGLGAYAFFGVGVGNKTPGPLVRNAFKTQKDSILKNVFIVGASPEGGGFEHIIDDEGNGINQKTGITPPLDLSYYCPTTDD